MSFKEEIVNFGSNDSLVAILTRSTQEVSSCPNIVFINAGLIHKIGPNRLYVRMARSIAMEGVSSVRFDFSGLGDSCRDLSTSKGSRKIKYEELKMLMDTINKKTHVSQFILVGICSGAQDAFEIAQQDSRIKGLYLIDGIFLENKTINQIYSEAEKKTQMRYYKKNALDIDRWKKVMLGKSEIFSKKNLKILVGKLSQESSIPKKQEIEFSDEFNKWKNIFKKRIKTNLIFCEGGVAIDVYEMILKKELETYENKSIFQYQLINDVDHTFTPIWAQNNLIKNFSTWILLSFIKESKISKHL